MIEQRTSKQNFRVLISIMGSTRIFFRFFFFFFFSSFEYTIYFSLNIFPIQKRDGNKDGSRVFVPRVISSRQKDAFGIPRETLSKPTTK